MEPTVSVLCVNWNTRELLRKCLLSLAEAEPQGFLQTIVVDNGSSDGSAEMVQQLDGDHQLIANEHNLGFTVGTNQAYAIATAPFVLMLNSDTLVPPGTIGSCVDFICGNPGVAAVGCRLRNPDGSHQSSIFRFPSIRGTLLTTLRLSQTFPRSRWMNWDRYGGGDVDVATEVDVVMGSFLLADRRYLDSRALLDDGFFMFGEETDLCRRIKNAGGRVVFLPDFSIVHIHAASSKSAQQVAWKLQANRRGILRYLRLWRRQGVAESVNLMMLLGLGLRLLALSASDLMDLLCHRPPIHRRLRASGARFHLRALFRPSVMDEPWGPPPVEQQ